jgi:hypothetical protein
VEDNKALLEKYPILRQRNVYTGEPIDNNDEYTYLDAMPKGWAKAKESISLDAYKKSMHGIYSTCIGKGTLDESPMAYKSPKDIIDNIGDTCDIIENIKPVYNFKASENG